MSTSVNPSILLVEDDVRLSELVSHYLESHGFRVISAARGDQVVDQVQRETPDLVILDLGLPGQDGFSICRQLRPRYTNPILILTARDNDIDHVLGRESSWLESTRSCGAAEFGPTSSTPASVSDNC